MSKEIIKTSLAEIKKQLPLSTILKVYEAVIVSAVSSRQEFFDSPENYEVHEKLEKLVTQYVPQLPQRLQDYLESKGYLSELRSAIHSSRGNFKEAVRESNPRLYLHDILSELETITDLSIPLEK